MQLALCPIPGLHFNRGVGMGHNVLPACSHGLKESLDSPPKNCFETLEIVARLFQTFPGGQTGAAQVRPGVLNLSEQKN